MTWPRRDVRLPTAPQTSVASEIAGDRSPEGRLVRPPIGDEPMGRVINFYHLDEPYGEFSNFARRPIVMDGLVWPTSEHWFQAQKFVGTGREASMAEAIRAEPSPRGAFNLGRDRSMPHRPDWESARDAIMRRAVLAKFTQHVDLRQMLLSTADATLCEHTDNDPVVRAIAW